MQPFGSSHCLDTITRSVKPLVNFYRASTKIQSLCYLCQSEAFFLVNGFEEGERSVVAALADARIVEMFALLIDFVCS